jgi:hypothetical protein
VAAKDVVADFEESRTGAAPVPFSLTELFVYFLRLGTFGFGGPIALVGYMQRDLVERRGWFTEEDYREGLALAQLATYLGWVKACTFRDFVKVAGGSASGRGCQVRPAVRDRGRASGTGRTTR